MSHPVRSYNPAINYPPAPEAEGIDEQTAQELFLVEDNAASVAAYIIRKKATSLANEIVGQQGSVQRCGRRAWGWTVASISAVNGAAFALCRAAIRVTAPFANPVINTARTVVRHTIGNTIRLTLHIARNNPTMRNAIWSYFERVSDRVQARKDACRRRAQQMPVVQIAPTQHCARLRYAVWFSMQQISDTLQGLPLQNHPNIRLRRVNQMPPVQLYDPGENINPQPARMGCCSRTRSRVSAPIRTWRIYLGTMRYLHSEIHEAFEESLHFQMQAYKRRQARQQELLSREVSDRKL